MKLTKTQIEAIREHTPKELKGLQARLTDVLGTYTKRGANWSYKAGYIMHNHIYILVVTSFGEII